MKKLFGTDGIRGLANVELTAEIAFKAGQAGAFVLSCGGKNPMFLIAQDTRHSCDMLVAALAAGICSMGVNVLKLGVLPTPGVAALVRKYKACAGVMVSASHNSFEDNGIKFFNRDGFKLPDALEEEIEAKIGRLGEFKFPEGTDVGVILPNAPAQDDYAEFLAHCVFNTDLSGLTIALDCANGAAFRVAPAVFEKLGAKVHTIATTPNGVNINENCGSTHMDALVDFVRQNPADAGFAFDGDGDRCFAVDSQGNIIDGDQIMTILAMQMKERGKLAENTVITTVMANMGFMRAMEENGLKAEQVKVGDRYVLERMKQGGFTLGGEQSGHIILINHQTTGDGLLTALALAMIMKTKGKKMSELNNIMKKYPQITVNAAVRNAAKDAVLAMPEVQAQIAAAEVKYEGRGRVLVRKSGTEALIRVMIEGLCAEEIAADAHALAKFLEEAANK